MIKISIIVPVFNVENYLKTCLNSLVNQSLKDIEIICIDDKSTDNSLNILKEYAQKDERIVILEQAINQGQGVARNKGLDIAKGKYVMFCDPDDWYELNACELLYEQIEKNQNDMVLFSMNRYYENLNRIVPYYRLSAFKDYFNEKNINLQNCDLNFIHDLFFVCQIYNRAFIKKNNIKFGRFRIFEDQYFSGAAFIYAQSVSILDLNLYNYRIRTSSTTFTRPNAHVDMFEVKTYLFNLIIKTNCSYHFTKAFLNYTIDSISHWYNFLEELNNSIDEDFYNKMHDFFVLMNEHLNLDDYKNNFGIKKYKKINEIIKCNYQQYKTKRLLKHILRTIFCLKNSYINSVKRKEITILGIKIRVRFSNNKIYNKVKGNYKKVQNDLKIKISRNKKINVLFLVRENSKWSYESVYQEMIKSDLFNPVVAVSLLTQVVDRTDTTRNDLNKSYDFFKKQGYEVVKAFNEDSQNFIDLKIFKPDLVFYDQCWDLPELHKPAHVSSFALTFYVPYAYPFGNGAEVYKDDFHKLLFTYFVWNNDGIKLLKKINKYSKKNCINAGYPKFDEYLDNQYIDESIYWKNPEKIKIIYAPHHSFEENGLRCATFKENGKFILELAQKHPETTWIFKPHPRFKFALLKNNIMTEKEIEEYYAEWGKVGNIYDKGNYINIFKTSDLLITDCISFRVEYFPTKKPIICPVNPKCMEFNETGKKIMSVLYKTYNNADIERYFYEIVKNNVDNLKKYRLELLPQIFDLQQKSAVKIIKNIEETVMEK